MSDIPYVNALGDAIETAIAPDPARRRRARRRSTRPLAIGLVALLTVAGGAAAAGVFSSPSSLVTNGVACYATPDPGGDVSVVAAGDRSPQQACAQALRDQGVAVSALVACDNGRGAVAVIPGSLPAACHDAGLRPLPANYATDKARVDRLSTAILALEARSDCVRPAALAKRVQALLGRLGWAGWTTELRLDVSRGPCGSVSGLGGNGVRSVSESLDAEHRLVMVFGAPHRSTATLLYSRTGLAGPIMDASGDRCYDRAGVQQLARGRLAHTGRDVRFAVAPIPAGAQLMGARGARLRAGCVVITELRAAADGLGIVVQITSGR